ncbi:hypothetical protein HDU98_011733 [Podochytrium sp. JEL0797]|nr:hypothetical protein HDU98_011733 [Podochytrium sp. JEL0797]
MMAPTTRATANLEAQVTRLKAQVAQLEAQVASCETYTVELEGMLETIFAKGQESQQEFFPYNRISDTPRIPGTPRSLAPLTPANDVPSEIMLKIIGMLDLPDFHGFITYVRPDMFKLATGPGFVRKYFENHLPRDYNQQIVTHFEPDAG